MRWQSCTKTVSFAKVCIDGIDDPTSAFRSRHSHRFTRVVVQLTYQAPYDFIPMNLFRMCNCASSTMLRCDGSFGDAVGWSEQEASMQGGIKLQIVNLLKAFRVLRCTSTKFPRHSHNTQYLQIRILTTQYICNPFYSADNIREHSSCNTPVIDRLTFLKNKPLTSQHSLPPPHPRLDTPSHAPLNSASAPPHQTSIQPFLASASTLNISHHLLRQSFKPHRSASIQGRTDIFVLSVTHPRLARDRK